MPRIIQTTLYQFDELSDKAKEKARDWWKELEAQDCDLSATLDDFKTIADLFGIKIKTTAENRRYAVCIYYSGFACQGDGASFEGSYAYRAGFAEEVKEYAPRDERLHNIADRLKTLQKEHGYRLQCQLTLGRGNYVHSGMMNLEMTAGSDDEKTERELLDIMRDLADWLYTALGEEYFSHFENDYVDDNIRANEYEFTAEGKFVPT